MIQWHHAYMLLTKKPKEYKIISYLLSLIKQNIFLRVEDALGWTE